MAHELDFSNGRANMAYVGERPWHGLGQLLTADASIDVWTQEAGLGFTVKRAPVHYQMPGKPMQKYAGRDVLYRHDTELALGIVTDTYKIVQPSDVMETMRRICSVAGFTMETAGSLYGGAKIWALARVGKDAVVAGVDKVAPYVLIVTSFDGTMATTVTYTIIRAVCNNTVSMAMNRLDESCTLRVPHAMSYDPAKAQAWLGIGVTKFEQWVARAELSAQEKISAEQADEIIVQILQKNDEHAVEDIRESKAYNQIMKLFYDGNVGSDMQHCKSTRYGLLNAVTYYADHIAGNKQEARLKSTWTGQLANLKTRAQELCFGQAA